MSPEEIKERIYDAIRKVAKTDEPEKFAEMNATAFEVAKKALEEISSLPTIKGWVARHKNNRTLGLYSTCPKRNDTFGSWVGDLSNFIEPTLFPSLRWEDEPIEVELPIIRK